MLSQKWQSRLLQPSPIETVHVPATPEQPKRRPTAASRGKKKERDKEKCRRETRDYRRSYQDEEEPSSEQELSLYQQAP